MDGWCENRRLKWAFCPEMDFQSAMETFAEAWVAANTQTPLTEAAEAQALALSRSNDVHVLSSPHEILIEKDNEIDGESTRVIANLSRSSAQDPHHSKACLRSSANTAKSIPVHCIVEQVPSPQHCDQHTADIQPTVELDSYAIVPSQTPFSELVRTALLKLGYASSDIIGAKGAIQIKNWKPLSFETITEDNNATVGEILGELTTVATLRIRLYSRPKISSANDVKEKLLQLLLTQSHSLLVSAGCPIEEALLTLISKGGNLCEIPEDTRRRFDQWYVQQVLHHRHQLSPSGNHAAEGGGSNGDSSAASAAHRTRMRTSFDPELELPKLHRWFGENQHPTRLQIQQYVRELNALESRKGRKPLDVNNVVYWFKNARAAFKRAEQRQSCNGVPHSPFHESASNDAMGRETSSEDAPTDADGQPEAGGKGSAVEAIDLSTTHRDAEPANGHWKPLRPKEGDGVLVKQEPLDGLPSSDDPDEEEEEDEDEDYEGSSAHVLTDDKSASFASGPQAGYCGPPSSSSSSSPPAHRHAPAGHHPHSILYMAGYMPTTIAAVLDERRKRNRTFIDPVTEVPRLEQWFAFNTHPPHSLILKYTDELNQMPYRQKFPKLEPKNVQFWFKNRRAKCKRLRLSVNLVTASPATAAAAASW